MPAARRKGNTIICSNRNCEKTLGIVKNGILEIKCRCGQFNDFVFDKTDPMTRITENGGVAVFDHWNGVPIADMIKNKPTKPILQICSDQDVPNNEIWLVNERAETVGKIVNIGIDKEAVKKT